MRRTADGRVQYLSIEGSFSPVVVVGCRARTERDSRQGEREGGCEDCGDARRHRRRPGSQAWQAWQSGRRDGGADVQDVVRRKHVGRDWRFTPQPCVGAGRCDWACWSPQKALGRRRDHPG
jgi:hypothetical protein